MIILRNVSDRNITQTNFKQKWLFICLNRGLMGLLAIGLSSSVRFVQVCAVAQVCVCVRILASFLNRLSHHGDPLKPQVCTLLISASSRKIYFLPNIFNRRPRIKCHFSDWSDSTYMLQLVRCDILIRHI